MMLSQKEYNSIILIICAFAVVATYFPSLFFEFVWDDFYLIAENKNLLKMDLTDLFRKDFLSMDEDNKDPFRSFYRPLISFSYQVDAMLFGICPFGFHMMNILWHVMNCLLLGGLIFQRYPDMKWGTLCAILVFALHPVHVENVSWISGRTDLICAFFLLCATHALTRFIRSGSMVTLVICLACYLAGLLSKEMAISYPFVVLMLFRILRVKINFGMKGLYAGFIICSAVYIFMRYHALGSLDNGRDITHLLLTIPLALCKYVGLLSLQSPLDLHHHEPMLSSVLSIRFIVPVLANIGVMVGVWYSRSRSLFAIYVYFVITLVPVLLNMGKFGDVMVADRFLYIPSCVLSFVVMEVFVFACSRPWIQNKIISVTGHAMILFYIAVLAVLNRSYGQIWRNEISLFHHALKNSSESAYVQNRMGMGYVRYGLFVKGIPHFLKALELLPEYGQARINLGLSYKKMEEYEKSFEHLRAVLKAPYASIRQKYLAHHNLAVLFSELNVDRLSFLHLQAAQILYPDAKSIDKLSLKYLQYSRSEFLKKHV